MQGSSTEDDVRTIPRYLVQKIEGQKRRKISNWQKTTRQGLPECYRWAAEASHIASKIENFLNWCKAPTKQTLVSSNCGTPSFWTPNHHFDATTCGGGRVFDRGAYFLKYVKVRRSLETIRHVPPTHVLLRLHYRKRSVISYTSPAPFVSSIGVLHPKGPLRKCFPSEPQLVHFSPLGMRRTHYRQNGNTRHCFLIGRSVRSTRCLTQKTSVLINVWSYNCWLKQHRFEYQ